jgi:hypothetical protein
MFDDYYFRAPSRDSFLKDIFNVLSGANIDPYSKNLIGQTEDGEKLLRRGAVIVESGEWTATPPTLGDDGDVTQKAETGDHALINIRTGDDEVQDLIESFDVSDAETSPSGVPDSEKLDNGTHRVTKPSSPVVTFDAPDVASPTAT